MRRQFPQKPPPRIAARRGCPRTPFRPWSGARTCEQDIPSYRCRGMTSRSARGPTSTLAVHRQSPARFGEDISSGFAAIGAKCRQRADPRRLAYEVHLDIALRTNGLHLPRLLAKSRCSDLDSNQRRRAHLVPAEPRSRRRWNGVGRRCTAAKIVLSPTIQLDRIGKRKRFDGRCNTANLIGRPWPLRPRPQWNSWPRYGAGPLL